MKNNKRIYIDFIIGEMDKGNIEPKDVVSVFCDKFRVTRRTFENYWTTACNEFEKRRAIIEKKKLEAIISVEVKAVKSSIRTRDQLLERLHDIIDQKAKRVEGVIVMPTYKDVIAAIRLYSDIVGYTKRGDREHPNADNELLQKLFEKLNAPPGKSVHDY